MIEAVLVAGVLGFIISITGVIVYALAAEIKHMIGWLGWCILMSLITVYAAESMPAGMQRKEEILDMTNTMPAIRACIPRDMTIHQARNVEKQVFMHIFEKELNNAK